MGLRLRFRDGERHAIATEGGGGRGKAKPSGGEGPQGSRPFLDRQELAQILNIYGRKVRSGEWRDYAIDTMCEKAVFSVFRRATETPFNIVMEARP